MVHIRKAVMGDQEQVFALAEDFAMSFRPRLDAFTEAFSHLHQQDDALVLVAEESEQIIGYLLGFDHWTFFANGRVSWVEEVTVHQDHRGRNIGRDLMDGLRGVGVIAGIQAGSPGNPESGAVLSGAGLRRIRGLFPQTHSYGKLACKGPTMYTPTLEQVKTLLREQEGNMVPLYREINADLETPVSAFLKIARGPYSFLLESVEGGERQARYSFIGTEPYRVLKTGPVRTPAKLTRCCPSNRSCPHTDR